MSGLQTICATDAFSSRGAHSDRRRTRCTRGVSVIEWSVFRVLFPQSVGSLYSLWRLYKRMTGQLFNLQGSHWIFWRGGACINTKSVVKMSGGRRGGTVWLVLALCACVWALGAHAVQFDVRRRAEKCLSDEVAQGSLVVIHYNVLGAAKGKSGVSIVITDPLKKYLKQDSNIDTSSDDIHKYSFHADGAGSYSVCFFNSNENAMRVMLDFKHGVEAKDYTEVAKREHLMPVEKELRKMEDTVDEIHREMLYMREREAAMRSTNESTNSRVLWFSFFSIAVLLAMGVWQVFYLKKFFKSKKLI